MSTLDELGIIPECDYYKEKTVSDVEIISNPAYDRMLITINSNHKAIGVCDYISAYDVQDLVDYLGYSCDVKIVDDNVMEEIL